MISWLEDRWPEGGGKNPEDDSSAEEERLEAGKNPEEDKRPEEEREDSRSCIRVV